MATRTRRLADLLANIDDNSKVTSAGLLDATITAADLADDSVGAAEIIDDAVTAAAIADNAVGAAAIASNAVTSAKVADNAVTGAKIAADTIPVKPHIQPGVLYPAVNGMINYDSQYTFTDSSGTPKTITAVGDTHHIGNPKIGTTSIRLDGDDYLTVAAHSDFNFGSSDFCIEWWWKGDFGGNDAFWSFGTSGEYWICYQEAANKIRVTMGSAGTRQWDTDSSTVWQGDGQWHHFALTKTGTTAKLYIDGTEETTINGSYTATPAASINLSSFTIGIGADAAGNYDLNASNLDEFRISNHIRYSSNFTPSTTAFSNDANTKFLLHSDNGGNSGAYGTAQSDGKKYYYTDIKGSKPIKDPRIGAHFGSQRHKVRSIQLLEQETATHGKNVYSIDGREWLRTVGGITTPNDSNSQRVLLNSTTDFVEIVGYFSDLNYGIYSGPNRTIKYSLDGAAESSDIGAAAAETPLFVNRYVPADSKVNLGLGATLGLHTIKLRRTGTSGINLYDIELIAQDTQDFTATNATNILTSVGHTLTNGDQIRLAGGDLPNGLNATTTYYVIGVSGNNFQVSASLGGSAVTFSDDGSGSRTFTSLNNIQIPAQNVVSYGKKFSVSATAQHHNPFAFKTDGTTAWASGAHNGTSWPVGTGASANIDTATSLGLENWKHSSNYYKPYNGGRVVKWVDSSGNIKTSVTVMPPNAQNVSGTAITAKANASAANDTYLPTFSGAIDVSLSEVAKTFWWSEYGNGNANGGQVSGTNGGSWKDFSMLDGTTSTNLGYCMDDGLTSLAGGGLETNGNGLGDNLGLKTTNSYQHTIFIGTGITVRQHDGAQRTFAQNLPYGTHILKQIHDGSDVDWFVDAVQLLEGDAGDKSITVRELTFHQPKKPPIPEDAVVLADYMLMADFKPQTTAGRHYISKGVRRQNISRDVFFNETDGDSFSLSVDPSESAGGLLIVLSGGADSDTSAKMRIPSFGTNYLHRGYQSDTRTKLFIGDTDKDSAATKDNTGSTGSYAHLTSDVELGIHQFGSNAASGQNGHIEGYDIVTPIHTSSHYQYFETPYLNELVGGDRSMEQYNLIVTPDGKSWDEVTRDTSYIGTSRVFASDDENDWNTNSDFKYWRGVIPTTNNKAFNKDFAIAFDRLYCLVDGHYKINYNTQNHMDGSSDTNGELRINNVVVALIRHTAASAANAHYSGEASVIHYLKRGDYINVHGERHMPNAYGHFEIFKI